MAVFIVGICSILLIYELLVLQQNAIFKLSFLGFYKQFFFTENNIHTLIKYRHPHNTLSFLVYLNASGMEDERDERCDVTTITRGTN